MPGGRPRKTKKQKQDAGTFREDRHKDSAAEDFAGGSPIKPKGLDSEQSKIWDSMINRIPGEYLGEIDTIAMTLLVDAFRDFYVIQNQIRNRAEDPDEENDPKTEYFLLCSSSIHWKRLMTLLTKFGMTPADRQKIEKVKKGDDGADAADAFSQFLQRSTN